MKQKVKFKKHIVLIMLLIVYLFSLLIVLFNSNQIFDWEECYFGTAAMEFIEGPVLPFFEYQYTHYQGGSILESLSAVPFIILFGKSMFSLKLGNLFFLIPTFILTYFFLDKFFNRKTAMIACILIIFAPTTYIARSLVLNGHIFHSMLFFMLILFVFFEIFYNNKKEIRYFMLLGIICGLALWFDYVNLVILILMLLFWFAFDKIFITKKTFLLFTIFFLIGFSPWIYYNTTHNFVGISQVSEGLNPEVQNKLYYGIIKLTKLFSEDFPNSFNVPDVISPLTRKVMSDIYYYIFITSFIGIFIHCRKSITNLFTNLFHFRKDIDVSKLKKETIILIYIIIYILIYSFSNFNLFSTATGLPTYGMKGYRYLFPLYPALFMIISLFIVNTWRSKNKYIKIIPNMILVIIVIIGTLSIISLISFNNLPEDKNIRNNTFCDESLASSIAWKWSHNPIQGIKYCNKLNTSIKTTKYVITCYEKIGEGIDWRFRHNSSQAIEACNTLEKKYRTYCYVGIGEGIAWRNNFDIKTIKFECGSLGPEYYASCFEGAMIKMS